MRLYIVDSFTDEPFKGNPAGVCFPEHAITEEKMQDIARELGLSETAFVKNTGNTNIYSIRYFSPKKEIPLCGHATLASAKIIFKSIDENVIHFITGEQIDLLIKRKEDEIIMEFPVYETVSATVPLLMLQALGLTEIVNAAFSDKNKIFILEVSDIQTLAALDPDFTLLLHSYQGINGVLVTAPSHDGNYDFHYKYFWPWAGTNEDPVTGGVQTFLAKYWSEKLGKKKMKAFQSSSRTGYMSVELAAGKVLVTGKAVIVLEGNLITG